MDYILTWVIKERDKSVYDIGVIERRDIFRYITDRKTVGGIIEAMKKYDKIVTYYGEKFDIPFIFVRAGIHRIPFIPWKKINHTDLYKTIKRRFGGSYSSISKRMKTACDVFRIPFNKSLKRVDEEVWVKGALGHKESLDLILAHNKQDCIMTEKLHKAVDSYAGNAKTPL